MSSKQAAAGVLFLITGLLAHADWRTLASDDGRTVEIAVDFKIDDVHIGSNGDLSIVATSSEHGEEVGFSALISKLREGSIGQLGKDELLRVLRSDIAIRSIGSPTENLERLLNHQLYRKAAGDDHLRLVGLYGAICPYGTGSFSGVSVFRATDVGLTYDQAGHTTLGDCFYVIFIVDGPMKRLTAYFSLPAGYGGTSEATRARQRWFESKKANGD